MASEGVFHKKMNHTLEFVSFAEEDTCFVLEFLQGSTVLFFSFVASNLKIVVAQTTPC